MSEASLPKQIDTIPFESIIDLKISGGFYARLHKLFMFISKQKDLEAFGKALASIKSGEPKDEYEDALLTMLTMVHEVEKCAKEQGKIKSIETETLLKKKE